MINNNTTMTAQIPSRFGMPAYGHALRRARCSPSRPCRRRPGVDVRPQAAIVGDMGLATKGDFPGTTAWRPPTC